jgi:hypothetical protein
MAPSDLMHEASDMIAMVSHPKILPDHFGDASRCPEFGAIAVRDRSSKQELHEPTLLASVEFGRSPGRESDLECLGATLRTSVSPAQHRTRSAADPASHLVQREAHVEKLQGTMTAIFQNICGSSRSHGRPSFTEVQDIALFMQLSIVPSIPKTTELRGREGPLL